VEVGSPEWRAVVARLFNVTPSAVRLDQARVHIGEAAYRVDRGVVLLDDRSVRPDTQRGTGEDVRRSFSEEWQEYSAILPEHDAEFQAYFDLVDLADLRNSLVVDLGCGSGRWSAKLAPHVGTITLVDFSDAIFVARDNLSDAPNAVFFRGDVTNLPFADDSVDFLFSLGVLHHLDRPCLPVARDLMRLGPRGLFYLYYALDNRPDYYRRLLAMVTASRRSLGRIESERARRRISRALAWGVYRPMVGLGALAEKVGIPAPVPLYESYRGKSVDRIEQDAYDRFFTSIEQRVSRAEIQEAFGDLFRVEFSEQEPFWHFLVTKDDGPTRDRLS
jgi:SAM-dependent methyltransferase